MTTVTTYDIGRFPSHDIESAPEKSKGKLQDLISKIGFAPNVVRAMAESPVVLESYLRINELFTTGSTFSKREQQLIFLVISRENSCEYCVSAHSFNASHIGLDEKSIEAIRNYTSLPDAKLNTLTKVTSELVQARGFISEAYSKEFYDAGYCSAQLLEVVLAIGIKVISNYSNHITHPPLDPIFEERKWVAQKDV